MRLVILTAALLLCVGGAFAAKDTCFECHSVMEGMSVIFKDDVHFHKGISCADCHGGDPGDDDQNVSMSAQRGFKVRVTRQGTPDFCGRCHGHGLASYRTSVHSQRLAAGNAKSAECVDCHGVHNPRAAADPLSPAGPQHLAETCGKCHAAGSAGAKVAAEMVPLLAGLKGSPESLVKARLAVHSFDVAAVKRAAGLP